MVHGRTGMPQYPSLAMPVLESMRMGVPEEDACGESFAGGSPPQLLT